ncbi:MAG: hypoxanthine-guanine phosphoribosyltransferase [Gammaproteobacteria bacterium]
MGSEGISREHINQVYRESDRLFTRSQVRDAYDRMAEKITARIGERLPLVLCVMNGGLLPAGALVARLHFVLQLDYIHATRYRGETRGAEDLHWRKMPDLPLADRTVLIVDDILDEGLTLHAIKQWCTEQGAADVLTAVLCEKRHDRNLTGTQADFVGLEVPDRYVFGSGMDYREHLRNAPGIFAVKGL